MSMAIERSYKCIKRDMELRKSQKFGEILCRKNENDRIHNKYREQKNDAAHT